MSSVKLWRNFRAYMGCTTMILEENYVILIIRKQHNTQITNKKQPYRSNLTFLRMNLLSIMISSTKKNGMSRSLTTINIHIWVTIIQFYINKERVCLVIPNSRGLFLARREFLNQQTKEEYSMNFVCLLHVSD